MRTYPSRRQMPFEEERPTSSLGPAFGGEQGDESPPPDAPFFPVRRRRRASQALVETDTSDAWLRQSGTTPMVENPPASEEIAIPTTPTKTRDTPPRQKAKRRGGPRVSRRTVLVGAGLAGIATIALTTALSNHTLPTVPKPATPIGTREQIAHLLRRAGFGAAPGEVETYAALGVAGAVDRLLNFQDIPNTVMDQRILDAVFDFSKAADNQYWWLARMVYSTHPLEEKMTLFWHGLLTSSLRQVSGRRGNELIKENNDFLRQNAFGRFDDLLAGITIDPAMLLWLNGDGSRVGAPNENYAREEMELFSMGVGNYSQKDIQESARALTGWQISSSTGEAIFNPRRHDNKNKTFLGQTGNFDYKDIARIICEQAVTPIFLSTRLWRFFAYEDPSPADIQPLVDAYHNHNHNIGAMVRALFTSPAFFSPKSYRSRVKSPTELVVGIFRNLGLTGIAQGNTILDVLDSMGQTLYDPPNVAGWPGDQISGRWITTGAWLTRVNTINMLVSTMTNSTDIMNRIQSDVTKGKVTTPADFVDYVLVELIDGQIDDARRQQLVAYVGTGASSGKGIKLGNGKILTSAVVRGLYYLVMAMPEYQLS
jgi:hypothetical protein